jgi:hypothetical protein
MFQLPAPQIANVSDRRRKPQTSTVYPHDVIAAQLLFGLRLDDAFTPCDVGSSKPVAESWPRLHIKICLGWDHVRIRVERRGNTGMPQAFRDDFGLRLA